MFRSRSASWDNPRWGTSAASNATAVPPVLLAFRTLVLVAVLVTVPLAEPHLGAGAAGMAVAVLLAVSAVSWVAWLLAGGRERVIAASLTVLGLCGGALAGLSPLSTAIAIGCIAASSSAIRLSAEISLAITAGAVAACLAAGLATGAPAETVVGYPLTFAGLWALGLTRRAFLLRAEQAEQMLAETSPAREAETHAAALAERARLAREIYDVLAHSLAAVSVNLQAAEGLLGSLPDNSPELAKAIECIGRAGDFTRDGLAEARRAIMALRDDAIPLPEQISVLAAEYRASGDMPVDVAIAGSPRPVSPEPALAAFRTAQEALTNARKHAPGRPVTLRLEFAPEDIAVRVSNPLPGEDGAGSLAGGGGHGLTGLRERAALAGGILSAGPAEHVNRIFAKTGSRDRAQAIRYAYTRGYAGPPGRTVASPAPSRPAGIRVVPVGVPAAPAGRGTVTTGDNAELGGGMAGNILEELLVSSEVQTARDRMEDYSAAEEAAEANPHGEQELEDLRQALVEMPGAVQMLLEAIDRAGDSAGEPQYDPGDRAAFPPAAGRPEQPG